MFTGIIEELGEIVALEHGADSAVLRVRGPLVTSDARHGTSIAVNGVCLTVVDLEGPEFAVDVMAETLLRTSLGALAPGSRVNLERSMSADGRFGGHIVQGHVDGTGIVTARTPGDRWEVVEVAVPSELGRYIVEKGSIAIDGISLTVVDARPDSFTVSLIPTTLELTNLGNAPVGTVVNIEVDIIGKYVAAQLDRLELDRAKVDRNSDASTTEAPIKGDSRD